MSFFLRKHAMAAALLAAAMGLFTTSSTVACCQSGGSEASLALSLMPVASVAVATGASATTASAAAGAVVALPVALSVAGAVLVVKTVEVSATGTVYLLERVSDGVQASIRLAANGAAAAAHGVGTVVACSVIGAGVILSVAGEVLAFIPNELGRALLHNERL